MLPLHDIFPKIPLTQQHRRKFLGRFFRVPQLSRRAKFYGACGLALFFVVYFGVLLAPGGFARGTIATVEKGMTLREVADALEKENVIRSALLFKGAVVLLNGNGTVVSGDYFFNSRPTFFEVARRVARGFYGLSPVKVTIPEGANTSEVAWLAARKLKKFDAEEFIRLTQKEEGYLFPDTYHFLPNADAAEVRRAMRENFNKKIQSLEPVIKDSGKDLHEIITMASLLEEEARASDTRRLIAGILWKRLDIGMALQVDATFQYVNGKNTFELTLADLADDSSPYNTYAHKGLPPGPISNPGLDSIVAALYPQENPYLFYLADLSGVTHYSRTFDEHKEKKFRYLP